MCGIAGIDHLGHPQPIMPETLQRMMDTLQHRGPDEFGLYFFQDEQSSVGFGHARLSIIDLAGGQQPLCNEDGTLWITFNGEIFNYRELCIELKQAGHQFATDSDTEVILHLYEEFGTDCLQKMNGQFSFAIWDERAHTLFAARDRVGIRPFFYTIQNEQLIFASEMKAILAALPEAPQLDFVTLDQIFTYWSPLPPRTAFCVRPATCIASETADPVATVISSSTACRWQSGGRRCSRPTATAARSTGPSSACPCRNCR